MQNAEMMVGVSILRASILDILMQDRRQKNFLGNKFLGYLA